jgi:hypothetical protein
MVLVVRASALLGLYRDLLPHVADLFAAYGRLPTHRRPRFLAEQYRDLPAADFSRDLLAHARGLAVFTWDRTMGWSDLGTPDRLQQWLGGRPTQLSA